MASVDPRELEAERGRVLGIERLVLEGVCFMFGVEGMEGVVRIARGLDCKSHLCRVFSRQDGCGLLLRRLRPLSRDARPAEVG